MKTAFLIFIILIAALSCAEAAIIHNSNSDKSWGDAK